MILSPMPVVTFALALISSLAMAQAAKAPPPQQYPPATTAAEAIDSSAASGVKPETAPLPPADPKIEGAAKSTGPAAPTVPAEGTAAPAPDSMAAQSGESTNQMAKSLLSGIIEEYNYDPSGKRDPFQPYAAAPKQAIANAEGPVFPLQKFDLDQLKLIGIIWEIRSPKAMILDPNGKGYIVRTNERLGKNNGYIAKIREGELVVVESFTGGDGKTTYQTKLVKLVQE